MFKFDDKIEGMFSKLLGKNREKDAPIQDYIPVEYIKDGIIKIKNSNEYRIILSVNAVNFFTKSDEEKYAIIGQFGVFLDSTKVGIQMVSQSKTINIGETLLDLKDRYSKSTNPYTKEYIAIYGNLLNNLSEDSNVLTKDFYLILKYTAQAPETFLSISKNFMLIANRAVKSLEGCRVNSAILKSAAIYKLLYLFYNKDKSKFQSISEDNIGKYMSTALSMKKKEVQHSGKDFSFLNQLKPGGDTDYTKFLKEEEVHGVLDDGIVTVEDIISSDGIEIEKDHLVVNNRYVRTIFISGILREECYPEWMSDIYTYPANLDISLHIETIRKKEALDELTKKYNIGLGNLQESYAEGRTIDERERQDVAELEELRKSISLNEEMYKLSFYISISADSLTELNDLTMDIETLLGNKQILTRRAILQQLPAFDSVLPVGTDKIKYYRNIPTQALATFFPYVNSELSCTNGTPVLYGANLLTGSLILFDRFNPPDSSITNYNTIICGGIGSGKSFATKLDLMRSYTAADTRVIVIDPNSEYGKVADLVGGKTIKIGGGSKDKINIFEISYYENEKGEAPDLLADKIVNLHSIFRMMFKIADEKYTAQFFNTMERAVKDTYALKGITSNPATLFTDNRIKRGNLAFAENSYKKPPTLSDLKYVLLERYGEIGSYLVNNVLDVFIEGSYNLFNGESTVDTSSKMLVFDIKDCNDSIKPLMYLILSDFVWEKVKRKPKAEKTLFAVDEAWIMMKNEFTARFLSEFARQCRKFNVGLCCITQMASDFFNDPWGCGKAIYANTAMHVLMKQDKDDVGIIAETYKISDGIRMDLLTLQAGYGYIFWGNTYTKIYFIASQDEFSAINTNQNITK